MSELRKVLSLVQRQSQEATVPAQYIQDGQGICAVTRAPELQQVREDVRHYRVRGRP